MQLLSLLCILGWWQIVPDEPVMQAPQFLLLHDKNGDRLLTDSELPENLRKKFSKTDLNADGRLDARELLSASTKLGRLARKAEKRALKRNRQTQIEAPVPPIPEPSPSKQGAQAEAEAEAETQPKQKSLPSTPALSKPKKSGYPTAEQIMENLDRNQNGVIEATEAVDRLSDNFASIDRNKDGVLDKAELERALRLARLFGIKPKIDPRKYQQKSE